MSIADEIKAVMEAKDLTVYRVWKDTGIDQGALSRFFSGERSFVADTLIRLLDYLGYDLTIRRKKRKVVLEHETARKK
jgi:transcriptional regulator with XRE-family HTH domain